MKNKKYNFRNIIFFIIFVSLGFTAGYMGVSFFANGDPESMPTPLANKILIIPIFIVGFFIALALHELGHVLAGLSVGFDFRIYTVGPFMIEKEEGRLLFKWNRNLNTSGGLALCLPRNEHRLKPKFIRFIAGGPSASFLWGLIALVLYWFIPFDSSNIFLWSIEKLLVISSLSSFLVFLITIVPMRSGGFFSDGARIINLMKGGTQSELDFTLLQLSAQLYSGIRPRELNEKMMTHAINLSIDSPFKAYVHNMLYYHYLDCNELEKAKSQLYLYESYLDSIPKGYQATVWLDKAYFEALYNGDAANASEYFKKADIGAIIPKSQVLRTKAAIAFVAEEWDEAIRIAEEAIKALPKSMDKGTAVAEKEWLESIIQKANIFK